MTATRTSGIRYRRLPLDSRGNIWKKVLSGYFPEMEICKMSMTQLESFVERLVRITRMTATTAGIEPVIRFYNKSSTSWGSNGELLLKSSRKEERERLVKLIFKSCDFFREYNQRIRNSPRLNDENFYVIETTTTKRKLDADLEDNHPNKRRRTLRSVNKQAISININTESVPSQKTKFLKLFNLSQNNNYVPKKPQVLNTSRNIKLHNCPQVPLSSDLGRAMMKCERYSVPTYVTDRKLERLEWYINKELPRISERNYEISYAPARHSSTRFYKFPLRQFHQLGGDVGKTEFFLRICKPLNIIALNDDLIALKTELDRYKVKVTVPRLTVDLLKKYLCRDLSVVLHKTRSVERKCSIWRRKNL